MQLKIVSGAGSYIGERERETGPYGSRGGSTVATACIPVEGRHLKE